MGQSQLPSKVTKRLLRMISSEDWPAGDRLPPMRQLAAQLRISPPTLAAAVRQLASQGLFEVRPRKWVRLVAGAAELARRLLTPQPMSPQPHRVAILLRDLHRPLTGSPFFHTLVGHITAEAQRRGLEATPIWWPRKPTRVDAEALLRAKYDGALCVSFKIEHTIVLTFLIEAKYPLVLFDEQIPGLKVPAVMVDNFGAARGIAAKLQKLGHRNLCLVTHPRSAEEIDSVAGLPGMASGWIGYLEEQGLFQTCTLPLCLAWRRGNKPLYDRAFRMLMASSERPTAIVFAFNTHAKEFLLDSEFSRLKVPSQLSLAILESPTGIPAVPHCPPLTNLEINFERTAQCLLETVEKRLNGDRNPPIIRVPLDMTLTDSIGPAPTATAPSGLAGGALRRLRPGRPSL